MPISSVLTLLSPFLLIAVFLYVKLRNPSIKIGPHRCDDANGILGTLWWISLLVVAVVAVAARIVSPWLGVPTLLALLVWGGLGLYVKWRERRLASPGTLVTSEWPVVSGRTVELAFQQRMHVDASAKRPRASLSLYERIGRWNGWRRATWMPLEPIELDHAGGTMHATWRLVVPDGAVPRRGFFGLPTPTGDYRWELHVTIAMPGGEELESTFRLAFAHPAGG